MLVLLFDALLAKRVAFESIFLLDANKSINNHLEQALIFILK
jgi:hypothetical protein